MNYEKERERIIHWLEYLMDVDDKDNRITILKNSDHYEIERLVKVLQNEKV